MAIFSNKYKPLLKQLADYIDFYNNQRIHEDLGGLTPAEFEQKVVSAKRSV